LLPTQARMLDAVDRNARRLMTLIENMLTTAKIEMGGFTTRRSPVDLAGPSRARSWRTIRGTSAWNPPRARARP